VTQFNKIKTSKMKKIKAIQLLLAAALFINYSSLMAQETPQLQISIDSSNKNYISINGIAFMPDTVFTEPNEQNRLIKRVVFEMPVSTKATFKEVFMLLQQLALSGQPVQMVHRKTDYRLIELFEKTCRGTIIKDCGFTNLKSDFDTILKIRVVTETAFTTITNTSNTLQYSEPSFSNIKFSYLNTSAYTVKLGTLPTGKITMIKGLGFSNGSERIILISVEGTDIAAWNNWYTQGNSVKNTIDGVVNLLTPDKVLVVIPVKIKTVTASSFRVINTTGAGAVALIGLKCKSLSAAFN